MRTASIPFILAPVLAAAQPLCDSLVVERFTYDPFGNGLHILLKNNSTQFLGYPYFHVLDDLGATIVAGQPFFFGIGPGDEQLHVLELSGGLPPTPFTGSLELTVGDGNGSTTCTFLMDAVSLCPPDSCFPFEVYALSQNTPIDAQMTWTISDPGNALVAAGQLAFTAGGQAEAVAPVCLPPGAYQLSVDWPLSGGQPFLVGVATSLYQATAGGSTPLSSTGSATVPFNFFAPCIAGTQGLVDADASEAVIALHGRVLHVTAEDGDELGEMLVMDGLGRTIRRVRSAGNTAIVDMGGAATGTYLLLGTAGQRPFQPRRFFLP